MRPVRLAPSELLAAIIAARTARFGGADGLTVNDRGRGLRCPPDGLSVSLAQGGIDALPSTGIAPLGIMVIDRAPGRVFARHHAPLDAGPHEIEDGVDNAAQVMTARPSRSLRLQEEWFKNYPLLIAQVGKIKGSLHPPEMGIRKAAAYECA